jgi:hypothetical protein
MAASGFTPIQLFRTTTASATPTALSLADGELAINLTDEKLYFKNAAGVVKLLASNSGSAGSVTSVDVSGGTTGLTTSGGPITSSGTVTLAGTLNVANGGTGVTTSTGTGSVVLSNSPTLVTPTLGAASATSIANGLGAVGTPSYTFTGDTNTGMWSPAADTLAFSTNGGERLRIDSSGNVGIGTNAPSERLSVNGDASFGAVVTTGTGLSTGDARLELGGNRSGDGASYVDLHSHSGADYSLRVLRTSGANGDAALVNFGSGAMWLGTNNTERMRIDSSGNLLVGTTSTSGIPTGSSSNPGAFIESTGTLNIQRNNNNNIFLSKASGFTSGGFISFQVAGSQVGFIAESGGGTVYSTTSDVRLKHDIVDAPEASALIDAIKVRSFKWNADNSEQRYGFVAQELVEVAPEAVHQPDEDEMMGVDYSKLVPMLVKEMQSMRARLAELEASASTITFQGN